MAYWCTAQLQPSRTQLALHMLEKIEGYVVYAPRLREHRLVRGRKVEVRPLLFVNYVFVLIESGWWNARWAAGVSKIVLDGATPAKVPDGIIHALKRREKNGAIEIPKGGFTIGETVRITRGALEGHLGIYQGQSGSERVMILLALLGRVQLRKDAIRPVT